MNNKKTTLSFMHIQYITNDWKIHWLKILNCKEHSAPKT